MWCCCVIGKVEKAGATALFQQEGKGSNNIGVVVNPVRLSSLTDFGTPQFVADRLLQAEKKKVNAGTLPWALQFASTMLHCYIY